MTDPVAASQPSLAGTLTGRSGAAAGPGGSLGKNEFLRLLTTQLRYQDPLDPMDGKDMASDLAQFSGLEQLLNINEQLEGQAGQYASVVSALNNNMALGTIDKIVVADGDKVVLAENAKGDVEGTVMADIAKEGVAVLRVFDRSGKEVGTRSLGYVGTGRQKFDVGSAAANLKEGAYSYRIEIPDGQGKDVPQKTYTVGRVDGISYGPGGVAQLRMGPLFIDLGAIVEIGS
jgi:flagellar basal-body rod modification protein FlgD